RNGGRDPYNAGLAHAFGAKGPARLPLFHNDRLDLERDIEGPRYLVIHHGGIGETAGVPDQLLAQCVAKPLDEPALDLSFNRQRVDSPAHVMSEPRCQHSDFSRVRINLHLNSLRTEGVHTEVREWKSDHGGSLQIKRFAVIDEGMLADERSSDAVMRPQRYLEE